MQLHQQRRNDALNDTLQKIQIQKVYARIGKTLHAVGDGAAEGKRKVPFLLDNPPLENLEVRSFVWDTTRAEVLGACEILNALDTESYV